VRLITALAIAGWLWALYERRQRCKALDRYIAHLDRDLMGAPPLPPPQPPTDWPATYAATRQTRTTERARRAGVDLPETGP
jgi:hypothetical protein